MNKLVRILDTVGDYFRWLSFWKQAEPRLYSITILGVFTLGAIFGIWIASVLG